MIEIKRTQANIVEDDFIVNCDEEWYFPQEFNIEVVVPNTYQVIDTEEFNEDSLIECNETCKIYYLIMCTMTDDEIRSCFRKT